MPSEARKRLGIRPGERLTVEIHDTELILSRTRKASDRLRGLGGEMWQGVDPVEYVRQMRDDWEQRQPEREDSVDR